MLEVYMMLLILCRFFLICGVKIIKPLGWFYLFNMKEHSEQSAVKMPVDLQIVKPGNEPHLMSG
jgi:hypothetical protein